MKITKDKIIEYNNKFSKDIGEFHRYKSWNILFNKFNIFLENEDWSEEKIDLMSLHLSMYLASWGMYRGSSNLLKEFNYKINSRLIKAIISNEDILKIPGFVKDGIQSLKDNSDVIGNLYSLIEKVFDTECKDNNNKESESSKRNPKISSTPTLVTKVMLGLFGCIPAYDTYAKKTMTKIKDENNRNVLIATINSENFEKVYKKLCDYAMTLPFDIERKNQFPEMKQLDHVLFGISFDDNKS